MRDYEEKSYYEIQLDNKQLILVFLAGVTVCVLIFILGVMVGKGKKEAEMASLAKAEPKTAAQEPQEPSKEPQDIKTAVETQPVQPVKETKGKKGKEQQAQTDQYSFYDLDKKDSKDEKLTPEKTTAKTGKEVAKTAQNTVPPKPEPTQPKAAAPQETPTTSAPVAEDTTAAPGSSRRYTVQVMATASKSKAEQQLSALKAKGYSAFMDEEKSGTSSVFKIRVGKFGDPDSAKKTAARLKQDLKLETWVAVLD